MEEFPTWELSDTPTRRTMLLTYCDVAWPGSKVLERRYAIKLELSTLIWAMISVKFHVLDLSPNH
jgi:hypothetical protein